MLGFHSVIEMQKRIRENRALLRKKSQFDKDGKFLDRDVESSGISGKLEFVEADPAYLAALEEETRRYRKRFRIQITLIAGIIALPVIGVLAWWFLLSEKEIARKAVVKKQEKKSMELVFREADSFLAAGEYHNAWFLLNQPENEQQNSPELQFRKYRVLAYSCQLGGQYCARADSMRRLLESRNEIPEEMAKVNAVLEQGLKTKRAMKMDPLPLKEQLEKYYRKRNIRPASVSVQNKETKGLDSRMQELRFTRGGKTVVTVTLEVFNTPGVLPVRDTWKENTCNQAVLKEDMALLRISGSDEFNRSAFGTVIRRAVGGISYFKTVETSYQYCQ